MHATANGRADLVGPAIQIGDFFPERRAVVVNGDSHLAWVTTNRRYPRRIQGKLDRYRVEYLAVADKVREPLQIDPNWTDEEKAEELTARMAQVDEADEAYEVFLTDAIMALVPTLDLQTVELMSRDAIESVLRELDYFPKQSESPAEKVEQAGATEETSPLTGDISTPASVESSQLTPSTDS